MSFLRAPLAFFAFTAPLGILAHFIAEFAGLGAYDGANVVFSARHGYLIAIAALALVAFAAIALRSPDRSRRERIEAIIESLPFRGTGANFVALSFAAQFSFFAATQIAEGCPLASGDVFAGALAAAFAALAGAFFVALGKRRIVTFAIDLVLALAVDYGAPLAVARVRGESITAPLYARRCAHDAFRNRPPPPTRL
jgi:protein-S-isoprenylcysteine O-methyltransferase Ste14